jgi:uncharacterized membrane protein YeaQ/YmgE (transglycosylase-associated protein family)
MSGRRALLLGVVASVLLTGLIWLSGGIPASVSKLPDQGALWYYWKLPHPTFWTRATSWGFFTAHQVAIWGCIWWAQRTRLKYTGALHPINYAMLGINGAFIGLHFLQTYIWYDGLAQDTSILSSQGAVIVLLVFVLIMETPRRGLFFGKRVPFKQEFVRIIRQYHGYFFSFAAIYTFWYHPMEATPGHLVGFFYMFLLLLQSSLIFNRAHLNRWWTFTLEFTVLPHGAIVAWFQGKGLWPMFLFGFAGILLITQLHGLPLGRWAKRTIYLAFLLAVLGVYGLTSRGFGKIDEIIRIPAIDYLLVGVIYLIFLLIFWSIRGIARLRAIRPSAA